MATKKWKVLPGGRLVRWKQAEGEYRLPWRKRVEPRRVRNALNRRERRRAAEAIFRGDVEARPYIHPHEANTY